MKRVNLLLTVFLMAAALPVALFAQRKESLAVFAFTGGSVSDGEAIASSLTRQTVLRNAFNRTTLITQSTIASMNFEQRFQRDSGLTDADTIFELGKQLNASHVIAGYITRLGDRNLVIVSIMDVESLQQIAGDYRMYQNIEEISTLIPEIAQKLAAAVPRNTSGLPGLSVPPFNIASGVNRSDAMVLAQILSCDLANGSKYAVLPRTDSLEAVLAEHRRQRDDTMDQERIRRLGVGRNAQYVLSGSVQRLGTMNMFTTDILNIVDGSFFDGYEKEYTDLSQGYDLIPILAMQVNDVRNMSVNNTETFTRAISYINAAGAGTYTITLTENILTERITFSSTNNVQKIIIIQGDSAMRTITNNYYYNLFSISKDIMLILGNNVTLVGWLCPDTGLAVTEPDAGVIHVHEGGRFEMRNGSVIKGGYRGVINRGIFTMSGGTISGNTAYNTSGGGVINGGTFVMNGGTISGNSSSFGGGVYNSGNFAMSGGTISGNSSSFGGGGGVYVDRGTFTMSDGTISGNTTSGNISSGGGVICYGTFTMSGGTISGNTANTGGGVDIGTLISDTTYNGTFTMSGGTISGNIASGNNPWGGGVYVGGSGTFTKTGGTISGYAGDTANGNRVQDDSGTVLSNRGNAVLVYIYISNVTKRRERTAGSSVNMDSRLSGVAGGWE